MDPNSHTDAAEALGVRIRQARQALGLSLEELAARAGFQHRQTLGELEHGRRSVKAVELQRIARSLHVDLTTLLDGPQEASPAVLWRSPPETGAEPLLADFLRWCDRYARILRLTGRCSANPLPTYQVDLARLTRRDAGVIADSVGLQLNLGRRPATVLQEAIQNQFDVLVWFMDTGDHGSAACTRGRFGSAILIPASSVPWRRNYDTAHELFHLLTWDSYHPRNSEDTDLAHRAEKLADSFAAALLMPSSVIHQELAARAVDGQVFAADLVPLAVDLDVSFEAFVWRLLNLRYLDNAETARSMIGDPALKDVDRRLRQRDRKKEPRLPGRYVDLAYAAWLSGRLSRARLAEYLDCSLVDLPRCLEDLGVLEPPEGSPPPRAPLTVNDFATDDMAGSLGGSKAPLCPA